MWRVITSVQDNPMRDPRTRGCMALAAFSIAIKFALVLFTIAVGTAESQTFSTLFNFDNTNGANPYDALVQGRDGSLYGTTYVGGATGQGVVFKISPNGAFT